MSCNRHVPHSGGAEANTETSGDFGEKKDAYELQLNTAAQKVDSQVDEINQENICLKKEMASLWKQMEKERCERTLLQEKNHQLSKEILSTTALNQQFREEITDILGTLTDLNRCDASCAAFDLCLKRILIVGNITKMERLYRQLIEGSGGIFDYHDGYMKTGSRQLESRLKRADMVLCPVSCNSHAACTMVKNLAKKHKKPVHMLANSSLSTLSQAILGTEKREQITIC